MTSTYLFLSGLLWNITFNPSANWTYEVTKINNMDIPVNASLRQKLREHFLLLRNTSNSILSFSVQKLLNKEDQFWINVAVSTLILYELRVFSLFFFILYFHMKNKSSVFISESKKK